MTLDTFTKNLSTLSEADLRELNKAVVQHIKVRRNVTAALKRKSLEVGQKVCWQGRLGEVKGTVVRIKRKKALCNVGGQTWDVPLSMLKAI